MVTGFPQSAAHLPVKFVKAGTKRSEPRSTDQKLKRFRLLDYGKALGWARSRCLDQVQRSYSTECFDEKAPPPLTSRSIDAVLPPRVPKASSYAVGP